MSMLTVYVRAVLRLLAVSAAQSLMVRGSASSPAVLVRAYVHGLPFPAVRFWADAMTERVAD